MVIGAFVDLAGIMALVVGVSLVMRWLKQPLIIGYLFTGILAGPAVLNIVHPGSGLEIFSQLGIALLLFIVGLGINPLMIKDVGRVSVIVGVSQLVVTSVTGYWLALLLGYPSIVAAYVAVAFTFSSTIIVVRMLHEKDEQDTLYGRIAIGILLVQDLAAMLIFTLSSGTGVAEVGWAWFTLTLLVKLLAIALASALIVRYVIPRIDTALARNREVLFLFALGLCFVMAGLFQQLHFSLELGALLAGVLLSTSPYQREIAGRIGPLRDFFLVMFFVVLGVNMHWGDLSANLWPILAFSAFVLVGKPLIMFAIMGRLGYTARTIFSAGLAVAQISEFSLILLSLGVAQGRIPQTVITMATAVGLITITISSYLITYNRQLFTWCAPLMRLFTRAHAREAGRSMEIARPEVLLFGAHRFGGAVVEALKHQKLATLVVDHDPHIIRSLAGSGVPTLFGSADDPNFLDTLPHAKLKLIISTIPDIDVNTLLIHYFKQRAPRAGFISVANYAHHAELLYREGAMFVAMPPYLGGRFMADLLKRCGVNHSRYALERKQHVEDFMLATADPSRS